MIDWLTPEMLRDQAPDLTELLRRNGVVVDRARHLSPLDAPRHRTSSYQIECADGACLKGRIAWDSERARRIEAFLKRTDPRHYPQVIARHERALLLPWCVGLPIPSSPDLDLFARAGRILGDLHQVAPPSEYPAPSIEALVAEHMPWIESVRDAGVLSADELSMLRRSLERPPFACASMGTTHNDFCAENMIIDDAGFIRLIDNEAIRTGSHTEDLARVWLRWSMTPEQRTAFFTGYNETGCGERAMAYFAWWALRAVLGSVRYRLGSLGAVAAPLARLRTIITAIDAKGDDLDLFQEYE